ncbi:glycine cleavage system protein GcvH [Thiolapillus sp.]
MSNIPENLKYTKSHEWVKDEGDGTVSIGISDHAQELLGDLVFVELPEAGASLSAGSECAVVESVKAASDVYSPVDGEVVEVNEELADTPENINQAPYDAWIFKVKLSDPSQLDGLLDAQAYQTIAEDD